MPPEISFTTPYGVLSLHRFPIDPNEKLRAWDAADEYLLAHIHEQMDVQVDKQRAEQKTKKNIIFGDGFGALGLGLHQRPSFQKAEITVVSDSAISNTAITANAIANKIDPNNIQIISSLEFSRRSSESYYDLALIKIPKSLAQLEDILRRVRPMVSADTQILGTGMVKNVHNSTLALFEKHIGTTTSSLAKKKARLIFASVKADATKPKSEQHKPEQAESEPAKVFSIAAHISKTPDDLALASYPGVFCHGSLDYGTQFLLKAMQIPKVVGESSSLDILDLGCGTGALGIAAAKRAPESKVTFVDESYAAIESSKEGIRLSLLENFENQYQCLAMHCLENIADESQDIILNNPPFHDAGARNSGTAIEMFKESKRVLRPGGQIQVVANLHLGYYRRLKEIFGNCETLASSDKFVVLLSVKNAPDRELSEASNNS
jgi:23S rRNA (guanine1835-N2)-methyltransferase